MRSILLEFEADDDWIHALSDVTDTAESSKRDYQIQLLLDQGHLTRAGDFSVRMTSRGHDFLDLTREQTIWERAKEAARETGGSATIELLGALSMAFLKKAIKDKTGIEL